MHRAEPECTGQHLISKEGCHEQRKGHSMVVDGSASSENSPVQWKGQLESLQQVLIIYRGDPDSVQGNPRILMRVLFLWQENGFNEHRPVCPFIACLFSKWNAQYRRRNRCSPRQIHTPNTFLTLSVWLPFPTPTKYYSQYRPLSLNWTKHIQTCDNTCKSTPKWTQYAFVVINILTWLICYPKPSKTKIW